MPGSLVHALVARITIQKRGAQGAKWARICAKQVRACFGRVYVHRAFFVRQV